MRLEERAPDKIIQTAIQVLSAGEGDLQAALEALPAPVYVTDASGVITYFNRPCIDFAGRLPVVGEDRWCVTWKLFTDEGEFLPHEECPMAVAIKERISVRGATAVAERPDGSRVNFQPYPTPLYDGKGKFVGAVNLLMDITERKRAQFLRTQAERCRRLAKGTGDEGVALSLRAMAAEYDEQARALDS
jgi:PAS domain S-box-containing protein